MKIKIANKYIGENQPCFIIAEAGSNHNGDISIAKKLIDAAEEAGADAIKFQKFYTEELVLPGAKKADYQIKSTGSKENQYEMLKKLELSEQNFEELKKYAERKGIIFFASIFDKKSADFMVDLGTPVLKIGSGDTNNLPLLKHIAKKNLPIILSVGMSSMSEIEEAIDAIKQQGMNYIVLMQCTSSYPAPFNRVNLKVIQTLKKKFGLPVGFSDHTLGTSIAGAAVALGACVYEKHFTLDKSMLGPDHSMCVTPEELKKIILDIKNIEKALGSPEKNKLDVEKNISDIARKSIIATKNIKKNTIITKEMLEIKRPGTGFPSKYMDIIPGKKAKKDITKGQILLDGDFE